TTRNNIPWNTCTLALESPTVDWSRSPLPATPPRSIATGITASGFCLATNATRIPAYPSPVASASFARPCTAPTSTTPASAAAPPRDTHRRDGDERLSVRQQVRHECRGQASEHDAPFAADHHHPHPRRHHHAQGREQQRRRMDHRVAPRVSRAERAQVHRLV